jgi:gamma-glutamyl-gamma-aminobutyrate hydrolase PuuD
MMDHQLRIALSFKEASRAEPYRNALSKAGLEVLSFSPAHAGSIEDVRGLVLAGGHDVDPALYGAAAHPETDPPERRHDDYELALLRAAIARQLPVLAICRGMQLLNVARDGTLVQHLPGTFKHQQRTGAAPVHHVTLDKSWEPIFGSTWVEVNSRHHQAVDQPGRGLVVTATDPDDGVIEGIAIPDAAFVVGVQWHPEDMVDDPVQMRLFESFADAVSRYAGAPAL